MALKVDVKGPENILLAGASVHLSARKVSTGCGSEGVNIGLQSDFNTAICGCLSAVFINAGMTLDYRY